MVNGEVCRNVVSFIELRFAYWRILTEEQIEQIQEVLQERHLKLELWMDDWDEDCGEKVSYRIIDRY